LLEEPPAILGGRILYHGLSNGPVDILSLGRDSNRMRSLRGDQIAMIFQEPMRALSPVYTIGHQVDEAILLHQDVTKRQARQQTVEMLDRVGISEPARRADEYPHELSGGQRQRVMIAMALACRPKLLIADEPTTALDVTIQAQILDVLKDLQQEMGLAVCLITHDLGIVAQTCRRVNVMYLGRIVESADVETIYKRPRHPYTIGLLKSVPVPGRDHGERLAAIRGAVPDPAEMPIGCPFGPRCDWFKPGLCDRDQEVPAFDVGPGHFSRCYRIEELDDAGR
jgi:oligopeptide/dipeptide ABC transporter ATP-binding protein